MERAVIETRAGIAGPNTMPQMKPWLADCLFHENLHACGEHAKEISIDMGMLVAGPAQIRTLGSALSLLRSHRL